MVYLKTKFKRIYIFKSKGGGRSVGANHQKGSLINAHIKSAIKTLLRLLGRAGPGQLEK